MRLKWISIMGILICFSATSCSAASRNYQYFLEHPEEIPKTLQNCNTQTQTEECAAASQAQAQVKELLLFAIQNRQAFGQKILEMQMQLAASKADLAKLKAQTSPSAQLQAQIKSLQEKTKKQKHLVKQYLAIIRLQGI